MQRWRERWRESDGDIYIYIERERCIERVIYIYRDYVEREIEGEEGLRERDGERE